jgi:hypothetical protein
MVTGWHGPGDDGQPLRLAVIGTGGGEVRICSRSPDDDRGDRDRLRLR